MQCISLGLRPSPHGHHSRHSGRHTVLTWRGHRRSGRELDAPSQCVLNAATHLHHVRGLGAMQRWCHGRHELGGVRHRLAGLHVVTRLHHLLRHRLRLHHLRLHDLLRHRLRVWHRRLHRRGHVPTHIDAGLLWKVLQRDRCTRPGRPIGLHGGHEGRTGSCFPAHDGHGFPRCSHGLSLGSLRQLRRGRRFRGRHLRPPCGISSLLHVLRPLSLFSCIVSIGSVDLCFLGSLSRSHRRIRVIECLPAGRTGQGLRAWRRQHLLALRRPVHGPGVSDPRQPWEVLPEVLIALGVDPVGVRPRAAKLGDVPVARVDALEDVERGLGHGTDGRLPGLLPQHVRHVSHADEERGPPRVFADGGEAHGAEEEWHASGGVVRNARPCPLRGQAELHDAALDGAVEGQVHEIARSSELQKAARAQGRPIRAHNDVDNPRGGI
mmetsp:Transcript_1204/g.4193  ORF Transcript_1204/g.4193 Transcript_1204/m.4193 type:complete len:436 (-) Transcript_1204:407-1714(-)